MAEIYSSTNMRLLFPLTKTPLSSVSKTNQKHLVSLMIIPKSYQNLTKTNLSLVENYRQAGIHSLSPITKNYPVILSLTQTTISKSFHDSLLIEMPGDTKCHSQLCNEYKLSLDEYVKLYEEFNECPFGTGIPIIKKPTEINHNLAIFLKSSDIKAFTQKINVFDAKINQKTSELVTELADKLQPDLQENSEIDRIRFIIDAMMEKTFGQFQFRDIPVGQTKYCFSPDNPSQGRNFVLSYCFDNNISEQELKDVQEYLAQFNSLESILNAASITLTSNEPPQYKKLITAKAEEPVRFAMPY